MNCVKVRIISVKIYAEHARICVQLSTEKAVHAVKTVNSAHSPHIITPPVRQEILLMKKPFYPAAAKHGSRE